MSSPIYSKVKATTIGSGLATAIATVLVAILAMFQIEMDPVTAVAIVGAVITIVQFVAGFFTVERAIR